MHKIIIGKITKPQGLKGEFRVAPQNVTISQLQKQKQFYINNTMHTVEKCVNRNTFLVFKVKEINTIEDVEKLRNADVIVSDTEVEIEKTLAAIENFTVIDELNNEIGVIISVNNYGATDILTIKNKTSEIMVPVIKDLIINTDEEKMQVTIASNIFNEISVIS